MAAGRGRPLQLLIGSILVMILGIVAASGTAMVWLWQSQTVLPGVQVLGMDLGGLSTVQAEELLSSYWRDRSVRLDAGDDHWIVAPETIGITFDPRASAQLAHRKGRSLSGFADLLRARDPIASPPVWQFDHAAAKASLVALAPEVEIAPVDAGIRIVGLQAEMTPARSGRRLDVMSTIARLADSPSRAVLDGSLPLKTVVVEPAKTDVSTLVDQANALLQTVVTLELFDPVTGQELSHSVTPEEWIEWLSLQQDGLENNRFNWVVDAELAKRYLRDQAQTLDDSTYLEWDVAVAELVAAISNQETEVSFRIFHHPTQHVVQPGDTLAAIGRRYGIPYPWIQDANPAAGQGLVVGQVVTIPSVDKMLPLPVVKEKRIKVSISQQRLWAYEEGRLLWEWPASTGIDSSPTSPGVFQIQSRETEAYAGNWDLWMPYFMGVYRPIPASGFMNGFHGFPTRNGSDLLWTGNLGRQATYGCILISTINAAALFDWADEGVVVEIQS
jgi:lipoprotein-anchoring transpeptidase ErfK/SrfK